MGTSKVRHPDRPGIRLRVVLGGDIAVGPGKADLLQAIAETGAIAAAGRRLGMSYKRAWLLVETMNGCFREPLVEAAKGGVGGGGATLTLLGEQVLAAYRRMEAKVVDATAAELEEMRGAMAGGRRSPPRPRAQDPCQAERD